MRIHRIGPFLLALGLVLSAVAGVGLLVQFEPAQLPPALLNIAAYKLTFLAAGGLLAAGAALIRYGRRDRAALQQSAPTRIWQRAFLRTRQWADVRERDVRL